MKWCVKGGQRGVCAEGVGDTRIGQADWEGAEALHLFESQVMMNSAPFAKGGAAHFDLVLVVMVGMCWAALLVGLLGGFCVLEFLLGLCCGFWAGLVCVLCCAWETASSVSHSPSPTICSTILLALIACHAPRHCGNRPTTTCASTATWAKLTGQRTWVSTRGTCWCSVLACCT
jgi:hypothetical protein